MPVSAPNTKSVLFAKNVLGGPKNTLSIDEPAVKMLNGVPKVLPLNLVPTIFCAFPLVTPCPVNTVPAIPPAIVGTAKLPLSASTGADHVIPPSFEVLEGIPPEFEHPLC